MLTYLRRLVDERTSLTEIQTRMADAAATESRELSEQERTEISRMQTRCAELDQQISEHNGQLESQRAYAGLLERIEHNQPQVPAQRTIGQQLETTSPGEAFTESEQFRAYQGHGTSGRVQIADYLELRAAITTANLAIPHFIAAPVEQTFTSVLLGMVSVVRVSAGVVDWVEIGPDPTAAVVAEGAAKPEATVTFTPKTSSLDTIAHWISITRQALDDASYIRSLLEGKLRRGLLKKVEADLAALIIAITTPTAVNASLSTAIRMAVGTVEANGYSPNAVLLNPADMASLDVAAAGAPGGTPAQRTLSYWGLTPVPYAAVPAGTSYVGDFREGATYFDRGVSDVFLSDSHQDLFIKNTLVILAETRGKSAITEPLAFCKTAAA